LLTDAEKEGKAAAFPGDQRFEAHTLFCLVSVEMLDHLARANLRHLLRLVGVALRYWPEMKMRKEVSRTR
jgi:hypothetical protein